jgi:DNA-directed RNA polymerase specialized sigma24 family protein
VEEPGPAEVRAAMAGDLAAFERLVRRCQAHVRRFLRHLLGDAALAEDVTQETFLRLYRRLPSFAGRSRFSSWVFPVARNADIDALRAARRRDRLLEALAPPPPGPPPEAPIEAMAAVASLSPSCATRWCWWRCSASPTGRRPRCWESPRGP